VQWSSSGSWCNYKKQMQPESNAIAAAAADATKRTRSWANAANDAVQKQMQPKQMP
jgi:hypothetical protein